MQLVGTRCNTLETLKDMSKITRAIELDLMFSQGTGMLMVGHPLEFRNFSRTRVLISLHDVLQIAYEEDLTVFLDLKPENIGESVAKELLKYMIEKGDWLKSHVIIIARSQENLVAIMRANLGLQTGWIFEGALMDPIGDAKRLGCKYFLGRSYNWTERFLTKVRAGENLKACACLVSSADEISICEKLGMEYVFMRASVEELRLIQALFSVCL